MAREFPIRSRVVAEFEMRFVFAVVRVLFSAHGIQLPFEPCGASELASDDQSRRPMKAVAMDYRPKTTRIEVLHRKRPRFCER